jgi:hypothetical protein
MSFLSTSTAIHIQMIQDTLLIQIDDFLRETVYMVKNEYDKIVRKGKFTGNSAQLNLTHLPSGHYSLGLNHDEEVVTYHFEKY